MFVAQMYREIAQQKKEKEDRAKANAPRERDYEAEHSAAVESQRKREENTPQR
jgi:hypothetical protein